MQNEASGRGLRLVTKSVRLDEEEAHQLGEFAQLVGESEAAVLKRVVTRGLAAERLHRALGAYVDGATSTEAAEIAGLPRAVILEEAAARGLRVIDDIPGLDDDLGALLDEEGLLLGARTRGGGRRR